MTAIVITLGFVSVVAIVMFGIYMIARINDILGEDLRTAKRENAELIRERDLLQAEVLDLKVENARLKNAKIHPADEP